MWTAVSNFAMLCFCKMETKNASLMLQRTMYCTNKIEKIEVQK